MSEYEGGKGREEVFELLNMKLREEDRERETRFKVHLRPITHTHYPHLYFFA